MRAGFYPKLAFDGIRKNRRMYLPFLLTCIGMVMMYYIIGFLQYSETLLHLPGTAVIREMVGLGEGVIAVFACIFLFYTNSFLMRRRKKEFGLYNMLGMGKRNIGRILLWEALIIAALSIAVGLAAGIACSKLAELGLVNIIRGDISYTLSVSFRAMLSTVKVFGVIFFLLFLNSLRQVRSSSAIALLRSENTGEKPPKGNWLLGLLGAGLLAAAYYIAVSIEEPVAALQLFFLAVILVIAGTYLLMIAGSVLFCRLLQKRRSYYYKANHFISVSSMVYRMKRNGAGLASICILATMVLVMISSTAALYFGAEDSLRKSCPRDIYAEFRFPDVESLSAEAVAPLRARILDAAARRKITASNVLDYTSVYLSGLLDGDSIEPDLSKRSGLPAAQMVQFHVIPLEDYNAAMGTDETLEDGEVLLWTYRAAYTEQTISIRGGEPFRVKKQVDDYFGRGDAEASLAPTMALIVPDLHGALRGMDALTEQPGTYAVLTRWIYCFDTGAGRETQTALLDDLRGAGLDAAEGERPYSSVYLESLEARRDDYFGLFGGLFYLGIVLSIVFLFATVLIIYYKQISEGYEDRSRFEIMQKVGITKREIRRSINSQLLTVFFLPLAGAGCHLTFAFPMIRKLLLLFNLNNAALFAGITAVSFLVFALFYTVIYRVTSNAYYRIVSGAGAE